MRDLRKAPGGRNSISAPPKSQTQADGMSSFGRRSSREENAPMTSSGMLMQSNVWQIGALRVGRGSSPVRESSEKGMNSSRSTASGTLRRLNVKANTIQAPIMYQSGLPTLALPYMLSSPPCVGSSIFLLYSTIAKKASRGGADARKKEAPVAVASFIYADFLFAAHK